MYVNWSDGEAYIFEVKGSSPFIATVDFFSFRDIYIKKYLMSRKEKNKKM